MCSSSNFCAHVPECSVNGWFSRWTVAALYRCSSHTSAAEPQADVWLVGTGRPSCGWWALQCQGAVTTLGLLWRIGPAEGIDCTTNSCMRSRKSDCAVLRCPLPESPGWLDANTHSDAGTRHPWKLGWQMSSCCCQIFRRRGSLNPTSLCTWELGSTAAISVTRNERPLSFEHADKNFKRTSKVLQCHPATREHEMPLRQECWVWTWGASCCLEVQVSRSDSVAVYGWGLRTVLPLWRAWGHVEILQWVWRTEVASASYVRFQFADPVAAGHYSRMKYADCLDLQLDLQRNFEIFLNFSAAKYPNLLFHPDRRFF